jgi:hypothetical protein
LTQGRALSYTSQPIKYIFFNFKIKTQKPKQHFGHLVWTDVESAITVV